MESKKSQHRRRLFRPSQAYLNWSCRIYLAFVGFILYSIFSITPSLRKVIVKTAWKCILSYFAQKQPHLTYEKDSIAIQRHQSKFYVYLKIIVRKLVSREDQKGLGLLPKAQKNPVSGKIYDCHRLQELAESSPFHPLFGGQAMPLRQLRESDGPVVAQLPSHVQRLEFDELQPGSVCVDKYVEGTILVKYPSHKLGTGEKLFKMVLEELTAHQSISTQTAINAFIFGKLVEDCECVLKQGQGVEVHIAGQRVKEMIESGSRVLLIPGLDLKILKIVFKPWKDVNFERVNNFIWGKR
uniref:uncharacterized protein n=1 Tax=Pristiophorus japonicus TaxID=55135 RepID=UPI00398F50B5